MRNAHTQQHLLTELARGQQPICVIEHEVPELDPLKEVGHFLARGATPRVKAALHKEVVLAMSRRSTAYDLLPQLIKCSPQTRFVITSHTRGFGLSPQQRALYKARPEILKVMGFVNSSVNTVYLLKLLSRVYFGKTWKPTKTP